MENSTQTQTPDQFKGKGALDAFLNLFSLITLAWTSIAIGLILFQIIDKFLSPGVVFSLSRFDQGALKFGVASALIVTPIFLLIVSMLHKNYKKGALNPQSGVYRWLTYLILLATALNIIGRLIQLVYQLLNGDYTLASVLKIFVVLAIASGIFGYYWYDLKRKDYSARSKFSLIFFILIIVIVLASIISSFFIIDTPADARAKKYDQQRVQDLSDLRNAINLHYQNNKELPENLSETKFDRFRDPGTNQPYEYKVVGENRFELCATFFQETPTEEERRYGYQEEDWYFHKAGYQCFTLAVFDNTPRVIVPPVRELPIK